MQHTPPQRMSGQPASPTPGRIGSDGDTFDLRSMIMTLWQGKWVILITIVSTIFLAFVAVSQMTPYYKASSKVMFETTKSNVVNVQDVLIDPEFSKDTLQNEIEVLKSSNLIERVVDALALEMHPDFNPALKEPSNGFFASIRRSIALPPEVLNVLRNIGLVGPSVPQGNPVDRQQRDRLRVVENVRQDLDLEPVRGSRVIVISYTSRRPNLSARIVNTIADMYIIDQLESKLEATRTATAWLSGRVDELRERVVTAENVVEDKRAQLALDAGQSLDLTQQQLQSLAVALATARNRTAEATAKYERLETSLTSGGDLFATNEFRESRLIQSFRETEIDLLSRESALKGAVGDEHPRLVRLRTQLQEVRSNISIEAQRIVEAVKIRMESAMAQEAALTEDVAVLEQKALDQSQAELDLRQLQREAQASRLLYENFLARLQETSQQEDLQSADARVLSPAQPPIRPESQRRRLILLLSALFGGALGVGIVFLMDKLNNTFRAAQQVEDITGLSVLAMVPAIGSKVERADVIKQLWEKPNSSIAEAIRNLRTSILLSNVDKPPKVVMFTSSVPREGKSTTSMLMALTSRQMGKTAVIVDCDLRLPALAKILQLEGDAPGLLSVMDGTASVEEAMYRDKTTGLDVLMARNGEKPAQLNAADLLSSQRFKALIRSLSDAYDLVILDTPPAVVVSDARIVAQVADAVVYAVRWDHTPRGAVIEGMKELQTVDAKMTGVVMTMVNESRAASYNYEGYGYYRGKYKDYYVS